MTPRAPGDTARNLGEALFLAAEKKEIAVPLEIVCDVDTGAGWLGSSGGQDSPDDISRGLLAAGIGVARLPELVRDQQTTTSRSTAK